MTLCLFPFIKNNRIRRPMFNMLSNNLLTKTFKKRFIHYNKYTIKAFKCKSKKDFMGVISECVNDTASYHKKTKTDISLEDIYRVLSKLRKKTPNIFRKITLKQMLGVYKKTQTMSDIANIFYAMSSITLIPIGFVGLKKIFGKRIEYVMQIYFISFVSQEIYKTP